MKCKITSFLALLLIGILSVASVAFADEVDREANTATPVFEEIKLEAGDSDWNIKCDNTDNIEVKRGDDIKIKLKMRAQDGDAYRAQVSAELSGYKYGDHERDSVYDSTKTFDLKQGNAKFFTLNLKAPLKERKRTFTLYLRSSDGIRDGSVDNTPKRCEVALEITGVDEDEALYIRDVVFSPEGAVKAGRSLLTTVRIKNYGDDDNDDIKVNVAIPELGVSASDYIDELESDDATTSEELYVRIPKCADPGVYTVVTTVEFEEYESVTQEDTIRVLSNEACEIPEQQEVVDGTKIFVATQSQDVKRGEGGATYSFTLSNSASSTKTYVITTEATEDWADVRVSPSNVVIVGAGETKMVSLFVSAKEDAAVGQHMFAVNVKVGDKEEQIPLTANVVEGKSGSSLKKGLEVGLIVLVVLLVILGLIIGFNKLKSEEEESEDEDSKTYY